MKYYLQTLFDTAYFPYYEFLWLGMLGLWWSVIVRLKHIQEIQDKMRDELIEFIVENEL